MIVSIGVLRPWSAMCKPSIHFQLLHAKFLVLSRLSGAITIVDALCFSYSREAACPVLLRRSNGNCSVFLESAALSLTVFLSQ